MKQKDRILSLGKKKGVVRAADLEDIGASRTMLPYLAEKGLLRRIARGTYVLSDYVPEQETFIGITAAVPHGVICLLSALQFHEITTQMPHEAWVAIERGKHVPRNPGLNLRIVKFSGKAFSQGIEEYPIHGITIRVYSPAKTVVDCFKFRNRLGADIAREALHDVIKQKKATRDEIWYYSKCCRMSRVVKPYLEMLT